MFFLFELSALFPSAGSSYMMEFEFEIIGNALFFGSFCFGFSFCPVYITFAFCLSFLFEP